MSLEAEVERLNTVIQELQLSKEKYKSRTKELLSTLESARADEERNADSLVEQTLSLRQIADQRDIEIRRLRRSLEEREAESEQLIEDNKASVLKQRERVIFDGNIEKLANVQKKTIAELEAELDLEKDTTQLLSSTIQALLQIFNVISERELTKSLPKQLLRIFRELESATRHEIVPVFIDENYCAMELLMDSSRELSLPRFDKRELYARMHANASRLDAEQDQNDDFLSFRKYLDKIQSDIDNERDLELKKTYIIQEQGANIQDVDFIPRNALTVMENFMKLERVRGNAIQAEEANNLLVQLSAVFHEYCQRLREHEMEQKIDALSKEVATLQRKLLLQKPFSQVQYEEQVERLRAVAQKYRDLYEEILDKKSIGKRVVVKLGDGSSGGHQMQKMEEELTMLREIVQLQHSKQNQPGQDGAEDMSGHKLTDSFQYQQGCLTAGRVLLSVIESSLGAIYGMKAAGPDVVERLKECQVRCRELLMDMLNGGIDDIDEEVE